MRPITAKDIREDINMSLTEDAGDVDAYFDVSDFFDFPRKPVPSSDWKQVVPTLQDAIVAARPELIAVVKKSLKKLTSRDALPFPLKESMLTEAEGEYEESLLEIIQHLDAADKALRKMLELNHDGIVTPREIQLMHRTEQQVDALKKMMDKGLDY